MKIYSDKQQAKNKKLVSDSIDTYEKKSKPIVEGLMKKAKGVKW